MANNQGGKASTNSSGLCTVVYPLSFSIFCGIIHVPEHGSSVLTDTAVSSSTATVSTSGATIDVRYISGNYAPQAASEFCAWIAMGY